MYGVSTFRARENRPLCVRRVRFAWVALTGISRNYTIYKCCWFFFASAEPRVVLPLNDTVYDEETGARIVQAFTFDQESQLSHDQVRQFSASLPLFLYVFFSSRRFPDCLI